MCPFCFATLALVAAKATSAGGLAAVAMKLSRTNHGTGESVSSANQDRPEFKSEEK